MQWHLRWALVLRAVAAYLCACGQCTAAPRTPHFVLRHAAVPHEHVHTCRPQQGRRAGRGRHHRAAQRGRQLVRAVARAGEHDGVEATGAAAGEAACSGRVEWLHRQGDASATDRMRHTTAAPPGIRLQVALQQLNQHPQLGEGGWRRLQAARHKRGDGSFRRVGAACRGSVGQCHPWHASSPWAGSSAPVTMRATLLAHLTHCWPRRG